MPSEYMKGTCSWCGDKTDIFRDNRRCEDCDCYVTRCHVCESDEHSDHPCRHVFMDRWGQWAGAGTLMEPDDYVRDGFFDLLDAMPASFARALRQAISSGGFYTWLIAPMIGGGGLLELNGMDYRTGRDYGDAIMRLGQETHVDHEGMADAYRWLASHYKCDTSFANEITIRWLDEWQDQRSAIPRMADDGCRLHA